MQTRSGQGRVSAPSDQASCTKSTPERASGECRRSHKLIRPRAAATLARPYERSVASAVNEPEYLGGLLAHQRLVRARLDVEPHQGLGIRAPEIEAPLGEFHRETVGEVD